MSKQKLPYFPLFFGDLLTATPRPKWKGQHRSLYIILLAHQWFYGPIPNTPAEIADMCDYPLDEFIRLWQVVGSKFVPCDGGLINLRCEEHREKAAKISKKRSTAGKKGGETTKQKAKQTGQQNGQQIGQQTGKQNGQQTEGQTGGQLATPFARPSIPSHPNPIQSTPADARSARDISRAPPEPGSEPPNSDAENREGWQRCKEIFPPYNGRKHWIMAESGARQIVARGAATWDVIEDRTKRYAEYCRLTGRQVMRPENFFTSADDPPCLQEWELPADVAQPATNTRGDDVIASFLAEQQRRET